MKVNCQLKNTGNHKQKAELRKIFHFATAPLLYKSENDGCCNQGRINDSTATHDQSSLSFVRLPGKRRQFTFFPQKNTSRGIL